MSQKFNMYSLKYILSQQLVSLLTGEAWLEVEIWKYQYTEIVIKTMGRDDITKR